MLGRGGSKGKQGRGLVCIIPLETREPEGGRGTEGRWEGEVGSDLVPRFGCGEVEERHFISQWRERATGGRGLSTSLLLDPK